MSEIFRLKRERFPAFSLVRSNINFEVQALVSERSPLAKAAAGLPVAVATPPEGSNPFPLRQFRSHHRTPAPFPRLLQNTRLEDSVSGGKITGGNMRVAYE